MRPLKLGGAGALVLLLALAATWTVRRLEGGSWGNHGFPHATEPEAREQSA